MAAQPTEPLIPLRLDTEEQWVLHHVLLDRLELELRSPSTTDPPPTPVFRVFDKLESGTHLFTATELRHARSELRSYLQGSTVTQSDRAAVSEILDRIDAALAGERVASHP